MISIQIGLSIDQSANIGAGGGGEPYVAPGVHFDGTAYLVNPSLVCSDTKLFSHSVWFKCPALDPPNDIDYFTLFVSNPDNLYTNLVLLPSLNLNTVPAYGLGFFDGGGVILDCDGDEGSVSTGVWHHILATVDVQNQVVKAVLDNEPYDLTLNFPWGSTNLPGNGLAAWAFADSFDANYQGDAADFWLAPGVSLLTAGEISEATLRKFITAGGKPVDLGATGSTPTGTAPAVFFSGDASAFLVNKGTGGAFTPTGAVTNASTSPSD